MVFRRRNAWPFICYICRTDRGDILDISWAWANYLLISGVLIIVIGKISDDKFKKEGLMILGYILNSLFTFGYLFVKTPMHLFIVQAGLGVASALTVPTWEALYSKYEDKHQEGYEWGLVSGEAQILTALGLIIGGLIVNYFSFKILFITMGSIQVIATIYQAQILKFNKMRIKNTKKYKRN